MHNCATNDDIRDKKEEIERLTLWVSQTPDAREKAVSSRRPLRIGLGIADAETRNDETDVQQPDSKCRRVGNAILELRQWLTRNSLPMKQIEGAILSR